MCVVVVCLGFWCLVGCVVVVSCLLLIWVLLPFVVCRLLFVVGVRCVLLVGVCCLLVVFCICCLVCVGCSCRCSSCVVGCCMLMFI